MSVVFRKWEILNTTSAVFFAVAVETAHHREWVIVVDPDLNGWRSEAELVGEVDEVLLWRELVVREDYCLAVGPNVLPDLQYRPRQLHIHHVIGIIDHQIRNAVQINQAFLHCVQQ